MTTALFDVASRFCGFSWLTGPIFDKELRVASRRVRNYFLRFTYVAFLAFFTDMAFYSVSMINSSGSGAFQVSRMSSAGINIICSVIGFQFFATHFIAAVMLSTAISDEVLRRTLPVLMTTPITSLQIIMGKLLSRLLQLILLLAISLPVLAIVRVFGGVPAGYLFSSFCITLTAAIFAGSVSLYLSIFSRRAYAVIMRTLFFCALIYGVVPGIVSIAIEVWEVAWLSEEMGYLISYANPFAVMLANSMGMLTPFAGAFMFNWVWHCLVMLCLAVVFIVAAIIWVRRVGLRQATGEAGQFSRRLRWGDGRRSDSLKGKLASAGALREVKGPAILWKEMRIPILGRGVKTLLSPIFCGVLVSGVYGYLGYKDFLLEPGVQVGFVVAYMFMILLRTATLAAVAITSEREARTWPSLLSTSLDEGQIIIGKILGAILRTWPILLLLVGHLAVFTLVGTVHFIAIFQLAVILSGSAFLVAAMGLSCSACFNRSTSALALGMVLAITFCIPLCCGAFGSRSIVVMTPICQAGMVMMGACERGAPHTLFYQLSYDSISGPMSFWAISGLLLATAALYMFVASMLALFAGGNLRTRKVF